MRDKYAKNFKVIRVGGIVFLVLSLNITPAKPDILALFSTLLIGVALSILAGYLYGRSINLKKIPAQPNRNKIMKMVLGIAVPTIVVTTLLISHLAKFSTSTAILCMVMTFAFVLGVVFLTMKVLGINE